VSNGEVVQKQFSVRNLELVNNFTKQQIIGHLSFIIDKLKRCVFIFLLFYYSEKHKEGKRGEKEIERERD
jgi:hypothetical protein